MPDESINAKLSDGNAHEEWRPVVGYEELYEVSCFGRVRNIRERKRTYIGRILNGGINNRGYYRVKLSRGNDRKDVEVHRLVALAFLGPCPEGIQVNHISGIKTENHLSNLEYVTHKENHQHASRMGLKASGDRSGARLHPEKWARGIKHHNSKLTESDVINIRCLWASGWKRADIGRRYGITPQNVRCIVRRLNWKHIP